MVITVNHKLTISLFLIWIFALPFVSYSQVNPENDVNLAVDTLNAKVETVKSDMDLAKKLKISGYVQAQWQLADTAGQSSSFSGGNFPKNSDNRFQLRRGRIKFGYKGKLTQFVFQIDATQSGVALRDAYMNFTDPWLQMFTVTGGLFKRPFGYEVLQSSGDRETPERSRIAQSLFPGERDLGAMITIQPRKESRFNFIRLSAALISGNAIAPEIDSRKDFVGQLGINRTTRNEAFRYAMNVSYYNGGYFQETKKVYTLESLANGIYGYTVDSTETNKGEYAKRQYFGADAQFVYDWKPGTTTIRGEYIFGDQPGSAKSNLSPTNRTFSSTDPLDTYNRPFSGGYVYFIQNILHSRHEIVIKYDWFDPNTRVAGNEIVSAVTVEEASVKTDMSAADIMYSTWGFGYSVRIASNVKLTAYYEMVKNETTQLAGFAKDVKDNVLTIRAQFKF